MASSRPLARLPTGVKNLDAILGGGIPRGSLVIVAGPPGSGKTILAQQMCFHNAVRGERVLYLNTLSEPTAKSMLYMQQFDYFDASRIDASVHLADVGGVLRTQGLEHTATAIVDMVKNTRPTILVIDSFKAFDDLAGSQEELRRFTYQLLVNLIAWECTTLLLGEYATVETQTNPAFSITDGLITMSQQDMSGEQQRLLQVIKLRGTSHSRDPHPFAITTGGIEVFAPRVTIHRSEETIDSERVRTGVGRLDELLGDGIPRGSSLLVSGVSGAGKTVLSLEFIYRGAKLYGERGIYFSFEETETRLRAMARGLGWDLDEQIDRGLVQIVFVPQPEILVDAHMLMMVERTAAFGARRVAVDSISLLLHKIREPQIVREKVFHLASMVQNNNAVGFFVTDVPHGTTQVSRLGVEETMVDGVLLLTAEAEGLRRQRYIEVFKLRNTAHAQGRHAMAIAKGGVLVFPRAETELLDQPHRARALGDARVPSGVEGLDALIGGGLLEGSITLVSGSAGTGKTTLATQFLLEGANRGERGIYVSLEETPEQIVRNADALGLAFGDAVRSGKLEIVYLPPELVRAGRFVSVLESKLNVAVPKRIAFDSISLIEASAPSISHVHELTGEILQRLRLHQITAIFTLESRKMYASDAVTEHGLSPFADNIVVLRYERVGRRLENRLVVVKTRGSAHDPTRQKYSIGKGGIRVEPLVLGDATETAVDDEHPEEEGDSHGQR